MISSVVPPAGENFLWTELRKGDKQAFSKIYAVYFPLLFEYCIRFTPDRNLIKDVLQDFFMGLLKEDNKMLAPVHNLKTYLLVSARRKLIRQLGRKDALANKTLNEEALNDENLEFCLELSPEYTLINRQNAEERSKRLQETIDGLTTRQREAVYLYFYENTPYEQIAEIMELKEVKYARTLIYRALTEIRQVLNEGGENFLKKVHQS